VFRVCVLNKTRDLNSVFVFWIEILLAQPDAYSEVEPRPTRVQNCSLGE
jgi:hypothetical protein